jgi:hypothetical protein
VKKYLAESTSEDSLEDMQDTDVFSIYLYKGQLYNSEEARSVKATFQLKKDKSTGVRTEQQIHKQVLEDHGSGAEEKCEKNVERKESVAKSPTFPEVAQDRSSPSRTDLNKEDKEVEGSRIFKKVSPE